MGSHIRLDSKFFLRPEVVKLRRRIGSDGLLAVLRLLTWAAEERPDGNLAGWDEETLCIAAGYDEPEKLVTAMFVCGLLVGKEKSWALPILKNLAAGD